MLLIGPVGNGKTHLVMGLAKYAVEHDLTIAVTNAAQFLDDLRGSYAAVRAGQRTDADRIVQRLTDVDLLVIDDLRVTDWTPWCRTPVLHADQSLLGERSPAVDHQQSRAE